MGAARLGHGTRDMGDPALVARLRELQGPLEICQTSNVCTGAVPSLAAHPFRRLWDAGLYLTLNSDDPPYFWTSLKREYAIAAEHFAMDDKALAAVTRTAIEAAFVDRKTKTALLAKLHGAAR